MSLSSRLWFTLEVSRMFGGTAQSAEKAIRSSLRQEPVTTVMERMQLQRYSAYRQD